MIIFSLLIATFISVDANASFNWLQLFQKSNNLHEVYDDYNYTQGSWIKDGDYSQSLVNFTPNSKNDMSSKLCGSRFYPAHPYATTKLYHYAVFKRYDTRLLPASSYSCRVTSRGKRKFCLAAGALKFVVISDTFFDSCGNKFRGYWPVTYNSDHENMGTLLAKGRTIEPVPNSVFNNDYRPSNTFEVRKSDFIYFSPLYTNDRAKIQKAINSASKFQNLVLRDNIFVKRR